MRLLIIYPDIVKEGEWSGYYYTGIGYLAAVARQAGHQVELLHIRHSLEKADFLRLCKERISPDDKTLIAFSATTNMFPFVKQWAPWIKDQYDCPTLVGGVHPTLNPDDTIATEGIDAVCIGEGEWPLVEFLDAWQSGGDVSHIDNIWLKTGQAVHKNPPRPLIRDLDTLPFPDRDVYDYRSLELEKRGIGVFMASRGCPYNCYYCCNRAIKERVAAHEGYVRFRSVGNVIEEIRQTIRKYPFIRHLHFDDDILPMKKEWFSEFATRYAAEIALPFECNMRPNLLNEASVELLRQAGCTTLRLGLESGNPLIRNKVLNRGLSEEVIVRAAALCGDAGIRIYTFNMVGMPFEDMSARLDTVKLNARINSDEEQVSILVPYEGTRLFDICKEEGLVRPDETTGGRRETTLFVDRVARNQISFTANYFTILVRVYRLFLRLPAPLGPMMVKLSDAVLSARITAILVYPPLNRLLQFVANQKMIGRWARRVKHSLFGKGRRRVCSAEAPVVS